MNVFDFRELKNTILLDMNENRIVVEELDDPMSQIMGKKRGGIKEYYINAMDMGEIRGADYYAVNADDHAAKTEIEFDDIQSESFLYLSDEPYYLTGLPTNIENSELLRKFIGREIKFVRAVLTDPLKPMYSGFANHVVFGLEDRSEYNVILTPDAKTFSMVARDNHMLLYPDYSIKVETCISNHYVFGFVNSLPDDPNEFTEEQIEELRFIQDQYPLTIFDKRRLKTVSPHVYGRIYENDEPVTFPENYRPVYGKTWEDTILKPQIWP